MRRAVPARVGPFRIVKQLGQGGFAPVFLAVEEHGGAELRTVALKVFAPEGSEGEDALGDSASAGTLTTVAARSRILHEARALCHVEHPNVVRFLQIVDDDASGLIGLAMEHVRGRSLAAAIDERQKLSVDETIAVGIAVASALAAVHQAGLVHRDVKPDNVVHDGSVYKLIDFGIVTKRALDDAAPKSRSSWSIGAVQAAAEALGDTLVASAGSAGGQTTEAPSGSDTFQVAGTMGYIDPVCLTGEAAADASSDLYSLGAVLYECLVGRVPAGDPTQKFSRLRMDVALGKAAPAPLREVEPEVDAELARLVDSLLAPSRQARPGRAQWVASELERLRRVRRGRTRPLPDEGPFRALESFDERHRDVFFGRVVEIASAVELLRTRGVVALVGASGSGKTSLARAGLLPAIVDGALGEWPRSWKIGDVSPGADPRARVASALDFGEDAEALEPAAAFAALAARVSQTEVGVLLFVDALEELVTTAGAKSRDWMGSFLAEVAARPVPGVRVVLAARRDFLDALFAIPSLGPAMARGVLLVQPLSASSSIDSLEERLAAYGYALEGPEMRGALEAELVASTADAMPLVEFAWARLWDERDRDARTLPRAALERVGGIAGALEQHAEATLRGLGDDALEVARSVLIKLTTPQGTRASRPTAELATSKQARRVLDALVRARLIVEEGETCTLAHDALVRQWPRLAAWVAELRRDREVAADVEAAEARHRARPDRGALMRGRALRDAVEVLDAGRVPVAESAREFVRSSQRAALRARVSVVAFAATLVVGGTVLFAEYRISEADTRAEKRAAREFVQTLVSAQRTPDEERARALDALLRERRACELDLARCRGQSPTSQDAGASGR